MTRIWHNYKKWEDIEMWRKVSQKEETTYLQQAIEFTGNAVLYGSWMRKVIDQWPVSCEHNLTNSGMNKRAWLGHAAVQMAIGCPEYITRMAWGHLTDQQRDEANQQATDNINLWIGTHEQAIL